MLGENSGVKACWKSFSKSCKLAKAVTISQDSCYMSALTNYVEGFSYKSGEQTNLVSI